MPIKRNTQVPQWIIDLLPGKYTAKDLELITGKTIPGITKTLSRYGVIIKREISYRNLYRNIYIWSGYKEKK